LFPLMGFNRVEPFGWAGEWEKPHVLMSQRSLVSADAVNVRGEHVVEQSCRVEESLEMDRVFLIPEDSRNFPLPTPLNDTHQLAAAVSGLVAPCFVFAAPC